MVVDSGFEIAGASQAISYELMYASGKSVKALGLKDHSVCVCVELENSTPSPEKIAEVARNILKNKNRREINAI